MKNLFFNENARDLLYNVMKSNSRSFGRPMQLSAPIKLFLDMENPLLKKYRFDPSEFLEGSEIALSNLIDVVDPSKVTDDECNRLLGDITVGDVKMGFLMWRSMITSGMAAPLSPKVKAIFINSVETDIVSMEDEQTLKDMFPSLGSVLATTNPSVDKDIPDDNETQVDPFMNYPVGSVIATVRVDACLLTGEEEETDIPLLPHMIDDNYKMVLIDFKSCISGQKELDWKISRVIFTGPLIKLVDNSSDGTDDSKKKSSSSESSDTSSSHSGSTSASGNSTAVKSNRGQTAQDSEGDRTDSGAK